MSNMLSYLATPGGPQKGIPAVDVNAGTWYPDKASIRWWPIQDTISIPAGGGGAFPFFVDPLGTTALATPGRTNLAAFPVPGNEAWYLWGLSVHISRDISTPAASEAAMVIHQIINGTYLTLSTPQQENYRSTLWKFFGPMQLSQSDIAPTLAASQPGVAVFQGKEIWPIPLVYQANSQLRGTLFFPNVGTFGGSTSWRIHIQALRVLAYNVSA